MPNLTSIGESWMEGSRQLEVVRFVGVPKLKEIGASFCYNCPALREVVLEDTGEVLERATIDEPAQRSLTSTVAPAVQRGNEDDSSIREGLVRVSGLPMLEVIGSYFVYNCSRGLTELVIQHLPKLTSLGGWCLEQASGLQQVAIGPGLPRLTDIGGYFLHRCSELEAATFDDLPQWSRVGTHALAQCPRLRTLRFSRIPKLDVIGDQFAAGGGGGGGAGNGASKKDEAGGAAAVTASLQVEVDKETCSPGLERAVRKNVSDSRGRSCCLQ